MVFDLFVVCGKKSAASGSSLFSVSTMTEILTLRDKLIHFLHDDIYDTMD